MYNRLISFIFISIVCNQLVDAYPIVKREGGAYKIYLPVLKNPEIQTFRLKNESGTCILARFRAYYERRSTDLRFLYLKNGTIDEDNSSCPDEKGESHLRINYYGGYLAFHFGVTTEGAFVWKTLEGHYAEKYTKIEISKFSREVDIGAQSRGHAWSCDSNPRCAVSIDMPGGELTLENVKFEVPRDVTKPDFYQPEDKVGYLTASHD